MDWSKDLCESGKRGWPNRDAAMAAARHMRRDPRGRSGRTPQTTYECRLCHEWHLTSRKGKGDRR